MAEQAVSRRVYVGGVMPELLAYRQRAEAVLRRRGYEPVFTERHNPRDQQALKMLRKKIAGCDAVICLVGFEFGDEPTQGVRNLPRRSFAQWEYALARELDKPVYRLICQTEPPPILPASQAPDTTPPALGDSATQKSALEKSALEKSHAATSDAGDSRRGPPPAEQSDERRALQRQFRHEEQNDEYVWDFDGPGDFDRQLAVLRFPWEPGVGSEKLVDLPSGSLGDCFVARAEVLAELDTHRQGPPDSEGRRVVALVSFPLCPSGGAGVGKTRLAVEYAERHLADFSAVAWIPGNSIQQVEAGLALMADHPDLDLSAELSDPSEEDRIEATFDWLFRNRGWLLIVDGVDTPEARDDVLEMLGDLTGGMLLLTGRVDDYPPWVSIVPVDSLQDAEGVDYLLRATDQRRWRTADEATAARELAELTQGLPLALEWMAAVIRQNRLSFAEYLARWRETAQGVAQQPPVSDVPAWVVTTWRTVNQQLPPFAQLLLQTLSWYGSGPLYRDWFEGTTALIHFFGLLRWARRAGITERAGDPFESPAFNHSQISNALQQLQDYRLLGAAASSDWLLVSRLTQEVTGSQMPKQRIFLIITHLLEFVQALVESSEPSEEETESPERKWLLLAPHVEAVAMVGAQLGIAMPTSQLLNDLAETLDSWCRRDSALYWLRNAIDLQEEVEPEETAILGKLLFNLGRLLRDDGQAWEAEPHLQRALAIAERRIGPNHADLVPYLLRLIDCLEDLDRLREAEPLLRRVLVIEERRLGPEAYGVQVHRGNLAVLMMQLGQVDEAEALQRRTLKCVEKTVGSKDPSYLRCLTNLGSILQDKGNHAEAEKVMRQSLELAEARFGPDHDEVFWRCVALGSIVMNRGDAAQAEPWLRRAAASEIAGRDDQAPLTARLFQLLGNCLARQGQTVEAEPWYRKSLALRESQVGPDHPDVGTLLGNLASLLEATNRADEAWELSGQRLRCYFLASAQQSRPHPGIGEALDQYGELGKRRGLSERDVIHRVNELLRQTGCPPQLLSQFADSHLVEVLKPLRDAESRRN